MCQRERIEHMRAQFPATVPIRQLLRDFVAQRISQFELEPPFLDLGAGYRSNEPEICATQLFDYYTLDVNPEFRPDFLGSAEDLSFLPRQAFGTVMCTEMLEHVGNPHKVVQQVRGVLRPSGRVVVSVPFWVPIHRKPPHQEDYWRFTPDGLLRLFDGFDPLTVESVGEAASPVGVFAVFAKV